MLFNEALFSVAGGLVSFQCGKWGALVVAEPGC